MTGRLDGQTVIITGGTKGIGRETAMLFAREGARVTITGRDVAAGEAAISAARDHANPDMIFLQHDVCSEADWERVVADTESRFGKLTGLVNNAGIFLLTPLAETSEADFDRAYAVNVEGTFLGVKHAMRAFARGETAGTIVNVSSLMGQVGVANGIAYCATKGAVTGLTKAAALEGAQMAPKVRVNSLHPGVIWTQMITDAVGGDAAVADSFAADTPLRMIGRPEYVADAILYLIGPESSYVTGAELTVDGGRGAD